MTNITLRLVKGSPLTNAEVDSNFSSLNDYKVEQSDSTGSALIPSGTTAQRDGSPSAGMFRYNTDLNQFEGYTTDWGAIGGSVDSASIQGIIDSDWTSRGINDLSDGKADATQVGLGTNALGSSTGVCNTAVGINSMQVTTTGAYSTAIGYNALGCFQRGICNTAVGHEALATTCNGFMNVAVGTSALRHAGTAGSNTAIGDRALCKLETGSSNVGIGFAAAANSVSFTTGVVAIGSQSFLCNTTGLYGVAIGYNAGYSNLNGNYNVAVGWRSSFSNTTGIYNTAIGTRALCANEGGYNVVLGAQAATTLTGGSNNIILGYDAEPSSATVSNEITIGDTNITSFRIPGLQSGATTGDVMCYNGTSLVLAPPAAGGLDSAGVAAIVTSYGYTTCVGTVTSVASGTGLTGGPITGSGTLSLATAGAGASNYTGGVSAIDVDAYGRVTSVTGSAGYTTFDSADALGLMSINNLSDGTTPGTFSVGLGANALQNASGSCNTAIGQRSQCSNTTGSCNTSVGWWTLQALTTGCSNVAIGANAGYSITCSSRNVFVGSSTGQNSTTAFDNTFVGHNANMFNTTGGCNVALGSYGLRSNTTGSENIAIGYRALCNVGGGTRNIAIGTNAMNNARATGQGHVAVGQYAMYNSQALVGNVAIGCLALYKADNGYQTAVGYQTLTCLTTGTGNVALGYYGLQRTTTGSNNTALGSGAMYLNTTGSNNVAVGQNAQYTARGSNNVAVGSQSLQCAVTGASNVAVGSSSLNSAINEASNNTALGSSALRLLTTGICNTAVGNIAGCTLTTGTNNTLLGNNAQPSAVDISNEITLGDTNITTFRIPALSFSVDSNGVANAIDFNTTSDINLKENIEAINNGIDIVKSINPVSFTWKTSGKKAYGVIAQEIEQLLPELVVTNIDGNKTVSYTQMIAFLIQAIQDQQKQIDELKSKL